MPSAETIEIATSKKANLSRVAKLLANVKGASIAKVKDKVIMSIVEKMNVSGEPSQLIIMEFAPSKIRIDFSIGDDEPPSFRRWEVMRKCIPILESVAEEYKLKPSMLFPILDKIVKEIDLELGKEAKQYYLEIDKLKRKLESVRRKLRICKSENEKLSTQMFDLTAKLNELKIKLAKYHTLSDEMLKTKLIEWIKEHNGEIDISEFSKVFGVKEQVVEEKLNELIKEGYINPV